MVAVDTPIRQHDTHGIPAESTKTSLQQRLSAHAQQRWPQLAGLDVRFRANFAYVTARLPEGDTLPLMRLRYDGSAARWDSPSTWPAATATKTPRYPPAPSPAHPRTPWTAPAASTWATPQPGPDPQRTYDPDH